jgi:hypothetical protein
MESDFSFVDYLLTFEFEVSFSFGLYLKGKPVYIKSKNGWEFDKDSEARDFFISKGNYLEHNIPDILIQRKELRYRSHLDNLFNEFKDNIQKNKSAFPEYLPGIIEKLGKSKTKYEKKLIYFTTDRIENEYFEEHLWHSEMNIHYSNLEGSNISDITNSGLVFLAISKMVESQLQVVDLTIGFLINKLESIKMVQDVTKFHEKDEPKILFSNPENLQEEGSNESENNKFKKIRFNDEINLLVTLFYDLHNKGYISTTKTNLEKFILTSFTDNNGETLNQSTVNTYLKLGREDKRAQNDKRIIVPDR